MPTVKMLFAVAAVICTCAPAMAQPSAPRNYIATDLGLLAVPAGFMEPVMNFANGIVALGEMRTPGDYAGAVWRENGATLALLGTRYTSFYSADNTQIVGTFDGRAALWDGPDFHYVDLGVANTRSSRANGVGNGRQVGYAAIDSNEYHAFMWSGTSESAVDLNPPKFVLSIANGVTGDKQVGQGVLRRSDGQILYGATRALLWSGSADSAIDLHPPFKVWSAAIAVADGLQVGASDNHAYLWKGSVATAVDLHPLGFGTSFAFGISGNVQIGYGTTFPSRLPSVSHALAWSGLASSVVDLHKFLDASFVESGALSIDSEGAIYGFATTQYAPLYDPHWIKWTPVPEPPSALLAVVGVSALRLLTFRRRKARP